MLNTTDNTRDIIDPEIAAIPTIIVRKYAIIMPRVNIKPIRKIVLPAFIVVCLFQITT